MDLKALHEEGQRITRDLRDLKTDLRAIYEASKPGHSPVYELLERLVFIVARMEARDRALSDEEER